MRRLSCALVAAFKAAVIVSRIENPFGAFPEEASKVIEGINAGKRICRAKLLF
jgi:hypothetical protein